MPAGSRGPWPWRSLDIETGEGRGDHGGGLVKRFDSGQFLCIRRVTYSFSFMNPAQLMSIQEHLVRLRQHSRACLLSRVPTLITVSDPWYELQWWAQDREDEEATPIMIVTPGSIYSVEMRFDWTVRDSYGLVDVSVKSLTGEPLRTPDFYFDRRPLTDINLYNFSASRACFSSVDVRYSRGRPETAADPAGTLRRTRLSLGIGRPKRTAGGRGDSQCASVVES